MANQKGRYIFALSITTKPKKMTKLNSQQIINHLNNGAILKKTYCVYSYWSLVLADGSKIYNMIKGAPETAKAKINYDLISNDKSGFSLKLKN